MAKLNLHAQPTLDAVDRAIEQKENSKPRRGYLGMSSIGHSCMRHLWYYFHWVKNPNFDAAALKRFDDGHRGEDVQAERLRLIPTVTLHTHNEDGGQFGFSLFGGHFKGHMDGAIQGLFEAPKTWHVWEHKQVAEKKQRELQKLIDDLGEKAALEKWNKIYYAQAVMYMSESGMKRHYTTVSSAGGRHSISCRTEENPSEHMRLKGKAKMILLSDRPLEKISQSPTWYECKWCDFSDVCHGDTAPDINCRTCAHSTPILDGEDGEWQCAYYQNQRIDDVTMHTGCDKHLFNPYLIENIGQVVDASATNNVISYTNKKTDVLFCNGQDPAAYRSHEILACEDKRALGNPQIQEFKEVFGGAEVVG